MIGLVNSPAEADSKSNDSSGFNSSSNGSSVSTLSSHQSATHPIPSVALKAFTLNDLKAATKNFRPDSYLGEGGFGCVFKGWIDENTHAPTKPGVGIVVAIKKLKQESFQGHKEWLVRLLPFALRRPRRSKCQFSSPFPDPGPFFFSVNRRR